jgi:hypothetical protein
MRNWDLISFTLQNINRQFSVYFHHLLHRSVCISCCLYAGLVQLQLLPQARCTHNATSHNKNSHAIHTNLLCIVFKWKEISDRQPTRKQISNGITLIALHVISNVLVQKLPPMLSERAVYTQLELCYRLKYIFISIQCGVGYHTWRSTIPFQTTSPFHFMISYQSKMQQNFVLPHRHQIIRYWYCSE